MPFSESLSADLDLLTQALDDPGVDLVATLARLAADAATAVPSFLGLSLTVTGGLTPVVFTALDDATAVTTSLLIPLLGADDAHQRTVSLVLYASTPGAFVDLAADLAWLTGIGAFVLDRHLAPPQGRPDAVGAVHAESLVNQAIGVLIASGLTPEAAKQRLTELALDAGEERHVAAAAVLHRALDERGDRTER